MMMLLMMMMMVVICGDGGDDDGDGAGAVGGGDGDDGDCNGDAVFSPKRLCQHVPGIDSATVVFFQAHSIYSINS